MKNVKAPDYVSDLILLKALNRQTEAARHTDNLDRSELLNELFRSYLSLRNVLNSLLEEAYTR
jgi:uncharacterized protein (UPF0297 family)